MTAVAPVGSISSSEGMILRVRGRELGGWSEGSVSLSVHQAAQTFTATTSERSPDDPRGRPIFRGDEVEIELARELLLRGYVDTVSPSYTESSHRIAFSGREATADLVDCSVDRPREFAGLRVEKIAQALARPYGIDVLVAPGVETGVRFDRFKVEPSETPFAAIERAARQRGLLVTSTGLGQLLLTRGGHDWVPGELGTGAFRILSAEASASDRDRYSEYRVIGQQPAFFAALAGLPAATPSGSASDPGVTRTRLKTIVAGEPGGPAELRERARWECSSRIGRSLSVRYVVRGWHSSPGVLWRPNRRARVRDSRLGVDTAMTITGVTFGLAAIGRTTGLELEPPEALEVEPLRKRSSVPELFGEFEDDG